MLQKILLVLKTNKSLQQVLIIINKNTVKDCNNYYFVLYYVEDTDKKIRLRTGTVRSFSLLNDSGKY